MLHRTMTKYWILIFCWFGVVSSQYINTAGPGAEAVIDPLDASIHYPPLPYVNYFSPSPIRNDHETFENVEPHERNPFYNQENEQAPVSRKRRTAEAVQDDKGQNWSPNLIDKDRKKYLYKTDTAEPYIIGLVRTENNYTDLLNSVDKRSFSPWGGKRSDILEHMWSWKRSPDVREPSMPKRVRFSPWGGKRSGQMVYKPETKGSKIIFSASVPELTRIVSNYPPGLEKLNIAGLHFTPPLDKRNPIKVLAISSQMGERNMKNDLQFRNFLEALPKIFNPGHSYANVNLKKDGKRKMKFSAWGGKRSPPIIGPIWTPTTQDLKDSTLDTIVLIRNNQGMEDAMKTV